MLSPGQHVELNVDQAAAGGRMIGRHQGQVVFVLGAIPGERVRVRVERVERQLAFATAVDVLEPSPDRRTGHGDLLCGGCSYAHIQYSRQLSIKSDVVADAFARLGRLPLEGRIEVAASPERGYRMRARLHVQNGQAGFYREGTHSLCDARTTGQLTDATMDAARNTVAALQAQGAEPSSLEISENLRGSQRVIGVEAMAAPADPALAARVVAAAGVSGCTIRTSGGELQAGLPDVADDLAMLTHHRAARGVLSRHAESFFQANRYLIADLVSAVLDSVPPDGDVLDLYAGVGLFAVALAATGRRGITAVEGDQRSGADLTRNAAQFGTAIRVVSGAVEGFLHTAAPRGPAAVVVDPPRSGMSRQACARIGTLGAGRIVYVSCDPPTMARDARRLVDAGYRLRTLRAFDLFPNTPHVESVGIFDREP